jgi:hypothetical protein
VDNILVPDAGQRKQEIFAETARPGRPARRAGTPRTSSRPAAEALADRLLQSIRPQVVALLAEAMSKEMPAAADGDELTPEEQARAAACAARLATRASRGTAKR